MPSFLDFINPFKDVTNLISEAVEDVDKANVINSKLMQAAEKTYSQELNTKTIPWVDALHKMGRQIQGYLGYGLAFYMVKEGFDPMAVMAAVAPSGIYAAMKNKK
jgi:hypothetical protein